MFATGHLAGRPRHFPTALRLQRTAATTSDIDTVSLLGERGNRAIRNTARNDVFTHVGHVGGDIESEAVQRSLTSDADTNGRNFARIFR